MEVYELLRKLRVERGISQKYLSDKITTRETYVKYENGKTNIPFVILIGLLEKMNLNLDEFIFYLDKDSVREKNWSLKKLVKNIRKDELNFQRTLRVLREKARDTNDIVDIRNYLVVKTVEWYQLVDSERKLSNSDKKYLLKLKNYLEAVDEWGRFEIATFSTLLFVFETTYIKGWLADIERKIEKNKDFEIFHSILLGMYNNAFLLMLERKESNLAKKYLEKISDVRHSLLFFGDTGVYYNFYKLLFNHLTEESGRVADLLQYFQGLKMIGSHSLSRRCKSDLRKFELIYNITPIFFVD